MGRGGGPTNAAAALVHGWIGSRDGGHGLWAGFPSCLEAQSTPLSAYGFSPITGDAPPTAPASAPEAALSEAFLGSADTPAQPTPQDVQTSMTVPETQPQPTSVTDEGAAQGVSDPPALPPTPPTFAERTFHTYQVNGCDRLFCVPEIYRPEDVVGGGAYGTVVKAVVADPDAVLLPPQVAVKKIPTPRRTGELLRLTREVTLLSKLRHPNVISLCDAWLVEEGKMGSGGLYIVTPLLQSDLTRIIQYYPEGLLLQQVQCLSAQLFAGLAYIHSQGVIHRDLKPQNLVVNADCDLRIVDFGLAREGDSDDDMTSYVVTRWYRPPELLLNSKRYTPGVDVWSAGCIVAEMLTGAPRFRGRDYKDQLRIIVKGIGGCAAAAASAGASEHALRFLQSECLPLVPAPGSAVAVPPPRSRNGWDDDEAAVAGFVGTSLLQFDPNRRVPAAEAAAHPCWGEYTKSASALPGPISEGRDSPRSELQRDLQQLDAIGDDPDALRRRLQEVCASSAVRRTLQQSDTDNSCAALSRHWSV